ncbi:GDP-mannose 4,6-dehydratase, partial [Rhizobium leguminosarum]|uniref:GDP-mannose 4,6-dehydratase n=1 Tax=Rhizobium leguminosarum TaxID=384 RepID=UPI003F95E92F
PDEPADYVLATGDTHSVRSFVDKAFARVGMPIDWRGNGGEEKGYDKTSGKCGVEIDPAYFRPTEVELLSGEPTKAHTKRGGKHE